MGIFDKLRGNSSKPDLIYCFTFKIAHGQTQIPPPMRGAYVVSYSLGETPTDAAERSLTKLRALGYVVEDMEPKGAALSIARWDLHISERWPEFVGHFPKQTNLLAELESRGAILSPFAGFE